MHNQNHPVFSTKYSPLGPGWRPRRCCACSSRRPGTGPRGSRATGAARGPPAAPAALGDFVWAAQEARPGDAAARPARSYAWTTLQSAGGGITCVAAAHGCFRPQEFRGQRCGLGRWGCPVAEPGWVYGFIFPQGTLLQAVPNTQVVHGFFVKHTEDIKESAAYPALVTRDHRDSTRATPSPVAPPPHSRRPFIRGPALRKPSVLTTHLQCSSFKDKAQWGGVCQGKRQKRWPPASWPPVRPVPGPGHAEEQPSSVQVCGGVWGLLLAAPCPHSTPAEGKLILTQEFHTQLLTEKKKAQPES